MPGRSNTRVNPQDDLNHRFRAFTGLLPLVALIATRSPKASKGVTILALSGIGGAEIIIRAKLMEVVKTVRLELVPREGFEPSRDYSQRILSP